VEEVAGGAALQQSFGTVIEVVDHGFDLGPEVPVSRKVIGCNGGIVPPPPQLAWAERLPSRP
jgi:hypothetical protein